MVLYLQILPIIPTTSTLDILYYTSVVAIILHDVISSIHLIYCGNLCVAILSSIHIEQQLRNSSNNNGRTCVICIEIRVEKTLYLIETMCTTMSTVIVSKCSKQRNKKVQCKFYFISALHTSEYCAWQLYCNNSVVHVYTLCCITHYNSYTIVGHRQC